MANANLDLLIMTVKKLGDIAAEFIFLGGSATDLFITDPGASYTRATKDIDVIVEVLTYPQYIDLELRLGKLGFIPDGRPDAPRCRFVNDELILDVMPINESILGLKSNWFAAAAQAADKHNIREDIQIRVVSPPYFTATKLEAFNDRGRKDPLASRDLEDILTVINGREELADEVANSPQELREFIGQEFTKILTTRTILDSIPGHLNPETDRTQIVRDRLRSMTAS